MAVGRSGEGARPTYRHCNGRHFAIRRARAQPKMWEYEVLMRDSGMSCIFAGYSSKKRDGWYKYDICIIISLNVVAYGRKNTAINIFQFLRNGSSKK